MAEYIDREQLDKAYLMLGYGEKELPRRTLQAMPAADVAPVVRCKNCSFWKRHTKTEKFYGACNRYGITKHENGFCDKGERRTDE